MPFVQKPSYDKIGKELGWRRVSKRAFQVGITLMGSHVKRIDDLASPEPDLIKYSRKYLDFHSE
jgi:hypothetical protein